MRLLNRHVLVILTMFCAQISPIVNAADPVELAWPAIERSETRPWTWWWWHGSAVTKADITANLEVLQKSGIGGVNIVCLLDVKDDQARKLGYLSKEWVEAVVHAKHEARRLGMDVDMSPVPGWAFGGPWVNREDACAVVELKQWKQNQILVSLIHVSDLIQHIPDPAPGKVKTLRVQCLVNGVAKEFTGRDSGMLELPGKPDQVIIERASYGLFPAGPIVDVTAIVKKLAENPKPPLSPDDIKNLDAMVLVTADGKSIDVTGKVREAGGVGGLAPAPGGTYYALITRRGSSRVRMPTLDGDGFVVDHLSSSSVRNYFKPFDRAFAGLTAADLPRAFNNDSWEITLDWTPGLLDEFAQRRGYDLRQQLPAFAGQGATDLVSRVACDYRETVADLMLDHFTVTFKQWASGHGCRITGEVIAEPGNDLDLNMLYDIPQADIGGPNSFFFPGGGDYVAEKVFRCGKFPASPAHILGKPLIASETLSCGGPILDTPLEQSKEKIDFDLVAGVNHTMIHGICYSPASARWPGWLFYAGTHLGPFNPMWRQGKALCDYIARCQSFLQAGRPDSDVVLYYPVHDFWSQRKPDEVAAPVLSGMESPGPAAGEKLWRAGYDFDFASDRLLESFKAIDGRLVSPGTTHRVLVVSGCRRMPAGTLERIVQLADGGATVVFDGELPADVPGLGRLEQRRAIFTSALSKIESARAAAGPSGVGRIGKGKVIFTDNVLDAMAKSGIQREAMVDSRLRYVRRSDARGTTYFITSLASNKRVDGWIPVAATGESAAIFDPMTGAMGIAEFRKSAAGGSLVRLQLEPRESRIVRVLNAVPSGPAWPYLSPAGDPITLTGKWRVRFLEGGETIPHEETIDKLASWTEWKSDQAGALRAFSGVASYRLEFPTPQVSADAWAIDLGDVCHTARVRLNGTLLGDLFCRPMRVTAAALAKDGRNILEIEVANAPINRAADLDIRGIAWQKTMGEDASSYIIGDFLFQWQTKDATWVPRPSGLLGPVRLIPLAKPQPSTAVDVTDLRCEYLKDPLGIDVTRPRLSWQIGIRGQKSETKGQPADIPRGVRQTAYQVLVASTPELLARDRGDLWDSGKVASDQSIQVEYKGKQLESRMQCYWRVRVWTARLETENWKLETGKRNLEKAECSGWSKPGLWTMGLLKPSDWEGEWIRFKEADNIKHIWYRKTFKMESVPSSAFAYLCSIGYHELYVNGKKIGTRVLSPGVTDLEKRALYITYDITSKLKMGDNVIAVWTGPGWARSDGSYGKGVWKQDSIFKCQVNMSNGLKLHSDSSWKCTISSSENLGLWKGGGEGEYGGELIDARRHIADWNMPSYDDGDWSNATCYAKSLIMSAEMQEPDRKVETLVPAAITGENGRYRIDMGRNSTGWFEIDLRNGKAGDTVKIMTANRAEETLEFRQESHYIFDATGKGTFCHRFNYMAGRWVTIEGLSYKPEPKDIRGYIVTNDRRRIGSFECSNKLFNEIYETDLRTYIACSVNGVTMDCPHRERFGYGEVALACTWGCAIPNYESAPYYRKAARDWFDVQRDDGFVNTIAPQVYKGAGGTLWSSAPVTLSWEFYKAYGDKRQLEEAYQPMKKWLDFLDKSVSSNGVLTAYEQASRFLGDWATPHGSEYGDTPEANLFNNCVYAYCLDVLVQAAGILGKPEDVATYSARLANLRKSVHKHFFNEETKTYIDGRQLAMAFPMYTGITPEQEKKAVFANFVEEISKRKPYLDTGSSGLPILLKYIVEDAERADLLFPCLARTEYPGYGFFLKSGETAWPEYWKIVGEASRIHTCYTGVSGYFVKALGGIRPDPAAYGMQRFVIKPALVGDLTWVKCRHDSLYGRIVSDWNKEGQKVAMEVTVSPNTVATVYVPAKDAAAVTEGGNTIDKVKGVKFLRVENHAAVYAVGSGTYRFQSNLPETVK